MGIISLCPSCQAKKQGLIQGAKMMIEDVLEWLDNYSKENGEWYKYYVRIKELKEQLADLKKLNNWLEKENEKRL